MGGRGVISNTKERMGSGSEVETPGSPQLVDSSIQDKTRQTSLSLGFPADGVQLSMTLYRAIGKESVLKICRFLDFKCFKGQNHNLELDPVLYGQALQLAEHDYACVHTEDNVNMLAITFCTS